MNYSFKLFLEYKGYIQQLKGIYLYMWFNYIKEDDVDYECEKAFKFACDNYIDDDTAKFSTFLSRCVKQFIRQRVAHQKWLLDQQKDCPRAIRSMVYEPSFKQIDYDLMWEKIKLLVTPYEYDLLKLKYKKGMQDKQIASIHDISVGNVYASYPKIIKKIKIKLAKEKYERNNEEM